MRVFLTGATGFLGSYIAHELLKRGHRVSLLIREETTPWRISDILSAVHIIAGDLNSVETWKEKFIDFKPEAIIHTAWQGVGNKEHNANNQLNNLMAIQSLIELATAAKCSHLIGAGSQAEYGLHNGALDESIATQPFTAYGAAKLAAYHWAKVRCEAAGIRFAWLRLFTIYGPADNPFWLIPSLITALRNGISPSLTLCEQLWDFLYVTDAASAFAYILECPSAVGAFNLGSGEIYSLLHVATTIRNLAGPGIELGVGDLPYRVNQLMHLEANIKRLKEYVNWSPIVNLEAGLKETVKWHESNINLVPN